MFLGLLCARFLLADMTEGSSPPTLYSSCFSCTGILRAVTRGRPNKETALATETFLRVDCDVVPTVCAVSNRVVSPDPSPVGYTSSAIKVQLLSIFACLPKKSEYALIAFLRLVD